MKTRPGASVNGGRAGKSAGGPAACEAPAGSRSDKKPRHKGFHCSSAFLSPHVCLARFELRHQEPLRPGAKCPGAKCPGAKCPSAKCPGADQFESGFACQLTRTAGADRLWNPDGAASCRFATRPPYGTAGPPGRLSLGKNETIISMVGFVP